MISEITDPKRWREYIEDDKNFDQEVAYDFPKILQKLRLAAQDLTNLNPYCTLSAIYDFTKFFYSISSALSMGFQDITKKVQQMREKFKQYPEAQDIQNLLQIEINMGIHRLDGDNNAGLGHSKGPFKKYVSACRTFLRLLWFLEFLIDVFETILKDNGNGEVKTFLSNSYNKVLAPRHTFLVRKAVGVALTFSGGGNTTKAVKIIFGYSEYNETARKTVEETKNLMKKIWESGYEFYKKNDMLNLT